MCYDIFVKIYVRTIQKTWSAVAETPFAQIIEENSEKAIIADDEI